VCCITHVSCRFANRATVDQTSTEDAIDFRDADGKPARPGAQRLLVIEEVN